MPRVICSTDISDILQAALNDNNISLKALGLLSILLSYKDININRTQLKNEVLDGNTSITTAFNELQKLGYLKIERNVLKDKYKIEYLYKLQKNTSSI